MNYFNHNRTEPTGEKDEEGEESMKRKFGNWARLSLVFFLLTVMVPSTTHAYLDPATGSYVFQMLIAGALTVSFVVKSYWHKIKGLFGGSSKSDATKTE